MPGSNYIEALDTVLTMDDNDGNGKLIESYLNDLLTTHNDDATATTKSLTVEELSDEELSVGEDDSDDNYNTTYCPRAEDSTSTTYRGYDTLYVDDCNNY